MFIHYAHFILPLKGEPSTHNLYKYGKNTQPEGIGTWILNIEEGAKVMVAIGHNIKVFYSEVVPLLKSQIQRLHPHAPCKHWGIKITNLETNLLIYFFTITFGLRKVGITLTNWKQLICSTRKVYYLRRTKWQELIKDFKKRMGEMRTINYISCQKNTCILGFLQVFMAPLVGTALPKYYNQIWE